jgi:16S rRNA (uracil1498-N3)-methyltransferase
MRQSRIFTDQPLQPDREVSLDGKTGHYLFRVLKLQEGDSVVLFNGDGADYAADLLSNRRDQVELLVRARLPAVAESPLHITLVQAVGKGDRMDYSLQKATELGVTAIQPLFTERTEVRLKGDRLARRQAHWQAVLRSACEQSGRSVVPELAMAAGLHDWLAIPQVAQRVVLAPAADLPLTALELRNPALEMLVGPEGGFAEVELKQLTLAGVTQCSLGPRVLRTETAGPAAIAVLQATFGDFAPLQAGRQ